MKSPICPDCGNPDMVSDAWSGIDAQLGIIEFWVCHECGEVVELDEPFIPKMKGPLGGIR